MAIAPIARLDTINTLCLRFSFKDDDEKKRINLETLPFFKVLPGQSSFSLIWEKNFTATRRNFRIDAHNEGFQPYSAENGEDIVLTSRNYIKTKSEGTAPKTITSRLKKRPIWKSIKNRKLTLQEKNFCSFSYVRKHLNFDIYNPVYSLFKITDSKLVRIWTMLFGILKEAAKSDLSDREVNLFNKWELATVLLAKENQNGPMSQQLMSVFDVKDYRLPRETEKFKFTLLNFLNSGIQRNNEFLKSQTLHGSSLFSILTHYHSLISNFGSRQGSLPNTILPNSEFTDRILWIASKFSCSHTTIWSNSPADLVALDPHVIWKCKKKCANCDGVMASMLTRNTCFLEIMCKGSFQSSSASSLPSDALVIKKEHI